MCSIHPSAAFVDVVPTWWEMPGSSLQVNTLALDKCTTQICILLQYSLLVNSEMLLVQCFWLSLYLVQSLLKKSFIGFSSYTLQIVYNFFSSISHGNI